MSRLNVTAADDLYSRSQIETKMHQWARGADRNDPELMSSVFHAGAEIYYGTFCGPAEEFIDWVMNFHVNELTGTTHKIFNLIIELDDDRATSEAGVDIRLGFDEEGVAKELLGSGRYLDHWERRHGDWRVASRKVILDTYRVVERHRPPFVDAWVKGTNAGLRTAEDASYEYFSKIT